MAFELLYCLCGQTNNNAVFMIQCDFCKVWFHGRCVGIREYHAVDIDRFHCPRCEPIHGPSVLKPHLNYHRHDYSEADAGSRAVQTGTQVFIRELKARHFPGCEDILCNIEGPQLTLPYLILNGFNSPMLVENKAGLDLVLPHNTFSVVDVENYVGPDYEVDVIDVQRQTNFRMQLHEFVEHFLSPVRTTVLNLISLEFSDTGLSQLVEPPYIVRKLCWVTTSWPSDPPPPLPLVRPNVNKYCLISVENSYTDFHVDFGGTSVWYHVLWGEKIFYLIKPTAANLSLYQRWMKASNQSEMFFGDQVDRCYKCTVKAGQTFFIPTGWIHAVLTPVDTLVFGGNFLHSYNIELQLQIYEMERQINTVDKFRFPHYESVCWYSAMHLVKEMREMGSTGTRIPPAIISGARCLMVTLRHWLTESSRGFMERPPPGLHPMRLLKELQKEVKTAERQVVALNPPKPERESKRRKKKVISDDFIDYTDLTSFNSVVEERVLNKRLKSEAESIKESDSSPNSASTYEVLERLDPLNSDFSKGPIKMTLPKPPPYSYGVGIGMSGTPPHDPNYPHFKNEYPSNVKSEFDWTVSELPQKYVEPQNLKLRLSRASVDGMSSVSTPQESTPPPPYILPNPHTQTFKYEEQYSGSPNSMYSYNDENDEREPSGLMIDENPTPRRRGPQPRNYQSPRTYIEPPLKIKFNLSGGAVIYGDPFDMSTGVEVSPQHAQKLISNAGGAPNGIDELLRASAYESDYVDGPHGRLDDLETGRASPSTRDAIAGMLSMSRVMPGSRSGARKLATTGFNQRFKNHKRRYFDEEYMNKVHQDEDYVYPSLDMSDDEDYEIFKARSKKSDDEAWNPKARVRLSGPKPDRPMRMGVKKTSVEKGLEQAASRRQNLPMAKRGYHRKKLRTFEPQPCTSSGVLGPAVRTNISVNTSNSASTVKNNSAVVNSNRPKRGMATAKQRLGKIMKIHKMKIH